MFVNKCALVFVLCLVICESAIVDLITKCSKDDVPCQTRSIQNMYEKLINGGVSELDLPVLDPYNVKNVTLDVENLVSAILHDGSVKGLKTCKITEFKPDFERGRTIISITCERLSVKGHYTLSSSSPLLKSLFGGEKLNGDGNVKVKLDGVTLKMLTNFDLVERNGEIYVQDKSFEILDLNIENADLKIDKVFVGEQDVSDQANNLFKTAWKTALGTKQGKDFANSVINEGFKFIRRVIQRLPISSYIIENLSSYVKQ